MPRTHKINTLQSNLNALSGVPIGYESRCFLTTADFFFFITEIKQQLHVLFFFFFLYWPFPAQIDAEAN